jgi:hypothetical protein
MMAVRNLTGGTQQGGGGMDQPSSEAIALVASQWQGIPTVDFNPLNYRTGFHEFLNSSLKNELEVNGDPHKNCHSSRSSIAGTGTGVGPARGRGRKRLLGSVSKGEGIASDSSGVGGLTTNGTVKERQKRDLASRPHIETVMSRYKVCFLLSSLLSVLF